MTRKEERLQWQAEDDARTMAQYQEILEDPSRLNRAVKAAKQEAVRLNKRANNMSKASNVKSSRTSKK